MSCGVGCRCASDLAWLWLWLWCSLAAAALIQPLAWELPYAAGAALKRKKKKKKKRERETIKGSTFPDILFHIQHFISQAFAVSFSAALSCIPLHFRR